MLAKKESTFRPIKRFGSKHAEIDRRKTDDNGNRLQLYALHRATGLDTRGLVISKRMAAELIGRIRAGKDITAAVKALFFQPKKNLDDMKRAEKLKRLAEGMTKQIDAKKNSATGQQRPTARRDRIAASMYQEGERLEKIQRILYGLAKASEVGILSPILTGITSRVDVETLLYCRQMPSPDGWPEGGYER